MLIIWGHRTFKKIMGLTGNIKCPNCNNLTPWQFMKATTWFTLFWIPIFPYSFKYFLICPICSRGRQVSKNDFVSMLEKSKTQLQPPEAPIDTTW